MHFRLFSLMAQRDRSVSPLNQEMVVQVKMAEQIGFDVAWFAEHHSSNYCLCPSPLAMAITLAPQTTTMRFDTAVIVAPLYHPLRMLEVGTGYQQYGFHRFGISLETARNTFLETLDVLEQDMAGSPVTYDGKAIKIPETHFVVHPTRKRPGVYVTGLARDPVTRGRMADHGYVPIFTTGWSTIAQMHETRDGAFLQEMPAPHEPPLEDIASRMIVGDAETCAEKLTIELTELQPVHVSCFMGLPDMPQDRTLRAMEMFGKDVIPRIDRAVGGLTRVGHAA